MLNAALFILFYMHCVLIHYFISFYFCQVNNTHIFAHFKLQSNYFIQMIKYFALVVSRNRVRASSSNSLQGCVKRNDYTESTLFVQKSFQENWLTNLFYPVSILTWFATICLATNNFTARLHFFLVSTILVNSICFELPKNAYILLLICCKLQKRKPQISTKLYLVIIVVIVVASYSLFLINFRYLCFGK